MHVIKLGIIKLITVAGYAGVSATEKQSTGSETSSRFAAPKSNEEVIEGRRKAVPKKTRQDTDYCFRLWEGWRLKTETIMAIQYPVSRRWMHIHCHIG